MGTGLDKLLWVALPLVLAMLAVAGLAWRRRPASRHGLNVAFSVLLLVYVLTTAGLGIFWVANQQLPVFDWHYLFGYATVLLLAVHLTFNLRIVWRTLLRKAGAAPRVSAQTPTGAGRRPWLGAAGLGGLVAAAGFGYLLGLRHGRTELILADTGAANAASPPRPGAAGDPAAPAPAARGLQAGTAAVAAADKAWAVVQQFHAFSAHSRQGVLRHAASTDWGLAPPPFKRYPGAPRIDLPSPRTATEPTPADMRTRSGAGTGATPAADPGAGPGAGPAAQALLTLADLGVWLWHTAGVSLSRGGIDFRTSPSSGALFATELYVVALDVPGLEAALLWHYDAEHHALHQLPAPHPAADGPQRLARLGPLALPPGCRVLVIASALFARSGHKYGDRTYRYVLADLGHALENLRVAALARGRWPIQLLTHFDEPAIGAALALDPKREGVLAVAAFGAAGVGPASSAAEASGVRAVPGWASALWGGATGGGTVDGSGDRSVGGDGAAAVAPATLSLTEAMQAATSLRALPGSPAAATDAPGSSASAATRAAPMATRAAPTTTAEAEPEARADAVHPLPPALTLQADWLQVIARRRSVRRFSSEPVSQQALAGILAVMTAPPTLLSAAVRIDVLSAAVLGLEPAAWRHDAARGLLLRRVVHGPALRRRARAAALDQDVIGDAAVVFVLSLERGALQADPFGPARGYRHGFIEAGRVGERLYLAAGALGLAVCAVGAFYDDEAAALVGLDPSREWPVHFAALGVPA